MDDLCEAVGFTQRRVVKHLEGLTAHGLAIQKAGGSWVAADSVQGLPEPRPGNPALAGRRAPWGLVVSQPAGGGLLRLLVHAGRAGACVGLDLVREDLALEAAAVNGASGGPLVSGRAGLFAG